MATTADILGTDRRPTIPRHWASYYERLCNERDRLLARDCSSPESFSTKMDELADAGSEETLKEMSLANAAATKETLHEVLDALRRIEHGNYGMCEITNQPIEAERLNAIPWARYSRAGQDELEKGGGGWKPALPAFEMASDDEPSEEED
jgi:RNA polymerase-binding transcription factor DksA